MIKMEIFPLPEKKICPHAEYCWLHTTACDNGFKHEDCGNWSAMQLLAKRHQSEGKYSAQCTGCSKLNIRGTNVWVALADCASYDVSYPHVFCPNCQPQLAIDSKVIKNE